MYIATYDIGTTAVKGVVLEKDGHMVAAADKNLTTYMKGEQKEQDPEEWYQAFCAVTKEMLAQIPCAEISGVIMSGQMQDLILIDESGKNIGNAVLYSDGRAAEEAEALRKSMQEGELERRTGNHYDGSLSLPKLLWIQKHDPERFRKTKKILISAKDYIIYRLSKKAVGDVTACSTAGAMNLKDTSWDVAILNAAGISIELFPKLYYPEQVVGYVTPEAAACTGLSTGTKVYAGIGDAGATTLASGISDVGEYNINLGTSGWVAAISKQVGEVDNGVFNLAAFQKNCYINVVPFLNGANIHRWVSSIFSEEGDNKIDYAKAEDLAAHSVPGSNGVVCLPYLNGERFPVMDAQIKGSFLGITPKTTKGDMIRSCLEGVAFSIRQGIARIGYETKKISVIGGGGRVKLWNQILADVLGQKVYAYKNAEYLPAFALASSVLMEQGKISGYKEFTDLLQGKEYSVCYTPDKKRTIVYDELYKSYLRLYPIVRMYYHGE